MKVHPYEIKSPVLLKKDQIVNNSQLLFQSRFAHFQSALLKAVSLNWPEFQTIQSGFRISSPSSPGHSTNNVASEQVLIGLVVAKFPNRVKAITKFTGILDESVQGLAIENLDEPVLYLKSEHFTVLLKRNVQSLVPGVVVALKGTMNTAEECFDVDSSLYPNQVEIVEVAEQQSVQNAKLFVQSGIQNLKHYAALNQFLQLHKFESLVISSPFIDPLSTPSGKTQIDNFKYSRAETFLDIQFDYEQTDQMLFQLAQNAVQTVVSPGLSSPVNRSYPQQQIPMLLELSSVSGVQFAQNPFFFDYYGKKCCLISGIFNDIEVILQSGLIIPGLGVTVDFYAENETFNYLEGIQVLVLCGTKKNDILDAKVNGETVRIICVQEFSGFAMNEYLDVTFEL
ncbi:Conserved_hypothetical protein [Hexamita inflata]|uniref:Uncharacterized protein n=1 Tax=Hexamita inflata TaxID=28002 RepID=A0AA86NHW7_9EUKA|nr:Conserved hypothetical protein [Hexamita inflata]